MDPALEHSAAPVTGASLGEDQSYAGGGPLGGEEHEPLERGQVIKLGGEAARYELIRPLGHGGTAEVFLARKVGPGDFVREVALKCMTPGLRFDDRARRAFVYEARLATRLRHPNIAAAYDLTQVGDRYYLVLEYVDGVTSRAAMQAASREHGPLSEAFCCHVAASIADALHHAHTLADEDGRALGIVHRDVSAKNVMIARSGVVKLLDFGIAIARMEGRDRTRTGTLKGTFSYLSPEQILGEPLDGRSDLFSLAILLVELLTGHRVFDAETEAGTIHRITECSPAEVRAATSAVPRALARICEKALSRRPSARFQDGAELAAALRRNLVRSHEDYGPPHCAAELRRLHILEDDAASGLSDTAAREPGDDGESVPVTTPTAAADPAAGGPLRRRRARALRSLGLVVLAAFLLLPHSAMREAEAAPTAAKPGEAVVLSSAPAAAAASAFGEPPASLDAPPEVPPVLLEGPIVRPKRSTTGGHRTTTPDRGQRPARAIAIASFADRPSVESAAATLRRGTLVPARLTRSLDPTAPGEVDAVVTDDVVSDGALIVPKGSTIVCSSRRAADGRVPVSCDTIRTGAGQLSFQGVAVGDGHRLGLRALDDEVAAGTAFVVYVNASAALR